MMLINCSCMAFDALFICLVVKQCVIHADKLVHRRGRYIGKAGAANENCNRHYCND